VVKTSTSARSPLSPTLWPPDAFRWWRSLGFAGGLFVAAILPAVLALATMLLFGVATLQDLRTFSWPAIASQFISYAAQLVVIVAFLPRVAARPLQALGLRAPRASDLAWGIGGAVAMVLAATVAAALQETVFHLKADEVQVQMLRATHGSALAGFVILACIAAPFFEELIFRGFVFNALLRYMPVSAAVIASALVFGGIHWQPGNAGALVPLMAGGAVLALVYYRSGSLIASMITHACFNLFTVVLVLVFHQT
jgi:membrane protease YdiL (CAAX protease family)